MYRHYGVTFCDTAPSSSSYGKVYTYQAINDLNIEVGDLVQVTDGVGAGKHVRVVSADTGQYYHASKLRTLGQVIEKAKVEAKPDKLDYDYLAHCTYITMINESSTQHAKLRKLAHAVVIKHGCAHTLQHMATLAGGEWPHIQDRDATALFNLASQVDHLRNKSKELANPDWSMVRRKTMTLLLEEFADDTGLTEYRRSLVAKPLTHAEALAKLQVGDWVKVTRKVVSRDNGWCNSWEPGMDATVGKTYQIVRLAGASGVALDTDTCCNFPAHVLEKVDTSQLEVRVCAQLGKQIHEMAEATITGKRPGLMSYDDIVEWPKALCDDQPDALRFSGSFGMFDGARLHDEELVEHKTGESKLYPYQQALLDAIDRGDKMAIRLPIRGCGKSFFKYNLTQPEKESPMALTIKQVTLVNGSDVSGLSDDRIFDLIRTAEAEIETLNKIKNQPRALKARIAGLQDGIDGLVKLLDDRTPATASTDEAAD